MEKSKRSVTYDGKVFAFVEDEKIMTSADDGATWTVRRQHGSSSHDAKGTA